MTETFRSADGSTRCRRCHLHPDQCSCLPITLSEAAKRAIDRLDAVRCREFLFDMLMGDARQARDFLEGHTSREPMPLSMFMMVSFPNGEQLSLRELVRRARLDELDAPS